MRACGFILLLAAWLSGCGASSTHGDAATDSGAEDGADDGQPLFEDSTGQNAGDAGSDAPAGDPGSLCPGGQPPALTSWTAEELHTALQAKDFLLINVASAPSIPGTDAIITYSDTAALMGFIGEDRSTKVVLYCQSGNRSNAAGKALLAQGYCAIVQLTGGKTAWVAAGYPLD